MNATATARPSGGWVLATIILVPVLYVLSFGPACWIAARAHYFQPAVVVCYVPLMKLAWKLDGAPAARLLVVWGELGEGENKWVARRVLARSDVDQ